MRKDFAPHDERISLHSDPMTIIRPEGDWDHPGITAGDAAMLEAVAHSAGLRR